MRRLAAITLTVAVAGSLAAILFGGTAQGSSSSRFDVIFDDARGLIGGQLVKIAGANAGTIQNVVVTPDFKARIEATVDSRFMPFHRDATCTIRPEGLIAENYVDCDPGTANAQPLRASGGHPPTVPVTNTTEPVSLLDLFNIFNTPTRQRFSLIVSELGIGTSGRGEDFNYVLKRANPALAEARQVISILDRQQAQLATIVDATSAIAHEGATHTAEVQRFLDQTAGLTTLTAAHSSSLSQSINRLPGLLAAAQPALSQLDTVAVTATPLVQQLHAAVPSLNRVENDLGPFVQAAKPALAKLTTTLRQAIPAIRDTTPLVTLLNSYVTKALPGTRLFAALASNLQQHGFVENFLSVPYYVGASLARFDGISHMLPLLLVGAQNGMCSSFATQPVPGCSAHYGSAPAYNPSAVPALKASARSKPAQTRTQPAAARTPGVSSATATATPTSSAGVPAGRHHQSPGAAPTTAAPGAPVPAPAPSGAVQQTAQTLQNLVNYLLK